MATRKNGHGLMMWVPISSVFGENYHGMSCFMRRPVLHSECSHWRLRSANTSPSLLRTCLVKVSVDPRLTIKHWCLLTYQTDPADFFWHLKLSETANICFLLHWHSHNQYWCFATLTGLPELVILCPLPLRPSEKAQVI